MRIDFVITEMWVGGAERCLTELAIGLARRGDEVRVFSLAPLPVGDQRGLVDRLIEHKIAVVSGEAARSRDFFRARRNLRAFLNASPPDVCQSFLFHAGVLASTLTGSVAGATRWVGGLRVAENRWIRNQVDRVAVARLDGLVCVSNSVRDFAIRHLGVPAEKTITIGNSVDVSKFATGQVFSTASIQPTAAARWPESCELVLFVGRMHRQKGIDLIQRQIDQIVPSHKNRRLLFVGDGPLASEVDQWCQQVAKGRAVRLPWQSNVASLYRRCHLLVLPSRYEGMPNVVMEAMAAGRPVVCSRVEGIAELLNDDPKQTFATGDDAQMARLVNGLLDDPGAASTIGAANQAKMRESFSADRMVDAYRRYYQDLIDRRP